MSKVKISRGQKLKLKYMFSLQVFFYFRWCIVVRIAVIYHLPLSRSVYYQSYRKLCYVVIYFMQYEMFQAAPFKSSTCKWIIPQQSVCISLVDGKQYGGEIEFPGSRSWDWEIWSSELVSACVLKTWACRKFFGYIASN